MPFSIVHFKVANFAQWKQTFESHSEVRKKAGIEIKQILQNIDDPNDVTVLSQVSDVAKAKALRGSPEMKENQRKAGVQGNVETTYFQ